MAIVLGHESDEVRLAASTLLQDWLTTNEWPPGDSLPEVRECFPLFTIDPARIEWGKPAIRDALVPLGNWHVQVCMDDQPIGYAQLVAGEEFEVGSWSTDTLARKVDTAVSTIDATMAEDDVEVVMVTAGFWQLKALVLLPADSEVEVSVLPLAGPVKLSGIEIGRLYSSTELLAALRELPDIRGVMD